MLSAANVLARDVRSALQVFRRADSISIAEQSLFGAINLRLDPRGTPALEKVQQCLGMSLPLTPNWVAASGVTVVWQAFDEWLLLTADGAQDELLERLHAALADHHAAITDVSDLRANFEIKGPHSRDLLAKGCAVDLHPRVFKTGDCALAALARVRVTLRQVGDAPAYQVLVERSYAQYLWDWLTDAALEFVGSA
jgi:sarcosine oxidase subunit gamma